MTGLPSWRLTAALNALAGENRDVWMTPETFGAFQDRFFPLNGRKGPKIADEIGLSGAQARERRSGRLPVKKYEALSCAHYALGFPIPLTLTDGVADTDDFQAWFAPRFGMTPPVNGWLDLAEHSLAALMRGYQSRGAGRIPRLADAGHLRALDWVWRVGPVVPWTSTGAAVYTGQEVAP